MVDTTNLDAVFDLDPDAWSPRKAVYAVAVEWSRSTGRRIPTNREVNAALRARGFTESTRKGVRGFRGIRVTDDLAAAPRISKVPGTATAWRQGDRSTPSREAIEAYEGLRTLQRQSESPAPLAPYDPFVSPLAGWGTYMDDAAAHSRVTTVLVARAESVHGPRSTWTCYHPGCRMPATTVDHIIPWSISHDSTPLNLRPACPHHNSSRGARPDRTED